MTGRGDILARAVADAEFRYADLLLAGADDTPYRLDLVAQGAQGPAVRLRVRLPSRSGSWPGIRLQSANSGAIISSMAARADLAVASKKRRARALLFSCSADTAASSSFFLPTGVFISHAVATSMMPQGGPDAWPGGLFTGVREIEILRTSRLRRSPKLSG